MKGKNLALILALSTGILINQASPAYADDGKVDSLENVDGLENVDSLEDTTLETYDENTAIDMDAYTIKDIPSLEEEVNALIKKFDDLEARIKNLESEAVVEATAEEKAAAKAQWDKGAIGFYEANGSNEAIEVFKSIPSRNGVNYKESTAQTYLRLNKIGSKIDENDSRNLDNMKVSIESLRDVNKKRQKDGGIDGIKLEVFGISDFDMAVAQANANYSSQIVGHSSVYGPPYENLAWSHSDIHAPEAIERWWDEEKEVFDHLRAKGLTSRDDMEAYIDHNEGNIQAKFRNPQVGHYLNLVDDLGWGKPWWKHEPTISAGYAVKKTGAYPLTKSIVMNPEAPTNRTVYTIDDYEERFLAYYIDLNTIVKDGKKIKNEQALVEMAKLIEESEDLDKKIKAKKETLTSLKKEQETYINLKKSVKESRTTIAAVNLLFETSPKKVAHVRQRLLDLIADSEDMIKQGEYWLRDAGMLDD